MNKKYVVSVGINDYPGTGLDLSGCVNDSNDVRDLFDDHGYSVEQLLDSDATKSNIMNMLRRHVHLTGYRDTLIFHYSGHGSWVPDREGDESDGRDEVLCAYDFQSRGYITDDELFEVFSERRFGARILVLSDSCHSGTVTRFVGGTPTAERKPRYLPPSTFLTGEQLTRANRVDKQLAVYNDTRTGAALISGSDDLEYSYDAYINGRWNGAFTYTALRMQELYGPMHLSEWHRLIRTELPNKGRGWEQSPQLTAKWHQKFWRIP